MKIRGGWSGAVCGRSRIKPKTGKAALSRNGAVKNRRSDSGVVFFASVVERREPSASGARVADEGSPERSEGFDCLRLCRRAGGVFVWSVRWKRQGLDEMRK